MSRSYRKNAKLPWCCVSLNGMRKWKHNTKQQRRACEKAQMNGIDEEDYDEETCTPSSIRKPKILMTGMVLTMVGKPVEMQRK